MGYSGDNSSFGNVTIHSSYRLVTWQGLNAYKVAPAQVSAVEIRDSFVSFRLSYLAATQAEEETEFARGKFDYVLVNDDLQKAFAEAEKVVADFIAR